ncbi:MAG: hypothetical protein AMXMBFR83_08810 [Phycisphaerae bacterium]
MAVSACVLIGMGAMAVDMGLIYRARVELQAAADAAALAAAVELLDVDRLKGTPNLTAEMDAARAKAAEYAAYNKVMKAAPTVDGNGSNSPDGDVVFGYLNNPDDLSEPLSFAQADRYNTVLVRVRRNQIRNGPIDLTFAAIFGIQTANLGAEAAATIKDGAVGFRVTPKTGNAGVLPLALHVDAWKQFLAGTLSNGDNYSYNSATGAVTSGSDGIRELNLYPGSGTGNQLVTPGNFGTVDIGSPNNSTADLSRQIRYGVNADDLAYFGGEFKLGPDGTIALNGDTGLSAAIKDDLESIKGQPRAIPLFSKVVGPGNNSTFTVVGFAGIRIVNVKLTGSMSSKQVLIQPAFVVDDTVITGPGSGSSSFVYEPVRLVR